MEGGPRKLEIFSKAPVGFTLHILHLISVVAIFFLNIRYYAAAAARYPIVREQYFKYFFILLVCFS
jgi:hypothetical protein